MDQSPHSDKPANCPTAAADADAPRGPTWGVVITYFPDLQALAGLLGGLRRQLDCIVVVDNGSDADLAAWVEGSFPGDAAFRVVRLGANRGIAAAQNVGIDLARQGGAAYVVLFDQDSEPAPDMISRLRAVAEEKAGAGIAVAAVGPRYLDERQNNPPPFIRVEGLRVKRQPCRPGESAVEVDYLIASGCLIPMATLDRVGSMREELFIDYVDIEWGLRAKQLGFQSFGACNAFMKHSLGDAPVEFFGRRIPLHSPLRHYYHFRNAVWMYRQRELPLHWKVADGWRLLLKYGFYTLFARPRLAHFGMMSLGIAHALANRMGELDARRIPG